MQYMFIQIEEQGTDQIGLSGDTQLMVSELEGRLRVNWSHSIVST